jgi:Fungal specific transcription factor domain/Fungal Zn(2)-Cys(6) binuclear cluster domain
MSNLQVSLDSPSKPSISIGMAVPLAAQLLNLLRIRRVKCDESQPHCQRCASTGRTCDGYSKEPTPIPPTREEIGGYSIVPFTGSVSNAENTQERRSFDFFRSETVPSIAGFFGSSAWNLVLQACSREPTVSQAVVALGALHEGSSISFQSSNVDGQRPIQTSFPLRQYSKALGAFRRYLSTAKDLDLNIILACALIHISIEVIQINYANAVVHLENSLQLLRQSSSHIQSATPDHNNQRSRLETVEIDSDLSRAFLRLDLQASTYVGMRAPAIVGKNTAYAMPARFSSISQAKDVLDSLAGQLSTLNRSVVEEYRYRKDEDIPPEAIAQVAQLKQALDLWDERFEKYLGRLTSKFSRQEQLVINVLLINHKVSAIEAATCTQPEASIFDQFDTKFDEIVTLAATAIWSRSTANSQFLNFSLDEGVIHPLYWTAIKCREPWIRQRAMSLLRSITFQEGVWDAVVQASIAEVAIAREQIYGIDGPAAGWRPPEFARVHSVGTNVLDLVRRVAQVNLTQRLDGLDGPWTNYVEWITW